MKDLAHLERFKVTCEGQVATVIMDAPPVNAQDRKFREEMLTVFDVLNEAEDVGAIILTGAGKTFSAGADLRERKGLEREPGGYQRHNRLVRSGFEAIMDCQKPVIAAVNGAAVGAGAVIALVSDILIVSEKAFIAMTEVDYGLAGGVRHILRSFSPSDARLTVLTARRISGSELFRMCVASACTKPEDLMSVATGIAEEIASKAPLAVEAAKASFNLTEEMPLRDGYRYEQTQTARLASTEDTQEALSAFAEKRKPVFKRK